MSAIKAPGDGKEFPTSTKIMVSIPLSSGTVIRFKTIAKASNITLEQLVLNGAHFFAEKLERDLILKALAPEKKKGE